MKARARVFEKWEGLGNDFVILDGAQIATDVVRALCDRRRGIGGDGVILVDTADAKRPRMIVYNADGTRPEMCGNGLRCVVGFLAERGVVEPGRAIVVATDAGDRRCEVDARSEGGYDVAVDMGLAKFGGALEVRSDGRVHSFDVVDVGNPHAITFESYAQADAERIAPEVATAPPGGTNVEFCSLRATPAGQPPCIDVFVWERGVGPTQACGTGACAVAALACETGRVAFDHPVRVVLPGGALDVTVATGSRALVMKGPARRAFMGEVAIP